MAEPTTLVRAALVHEAINLFVSDFAQNFALDRSLGKLCRSSQNILAVDEHDRGERNLRTSCNAQQFNLNLLALCDLFLFSTRSNNCVHIELRAYLFGQPKITEIQLKIYRKLVEHRVINHDPSAFTSWASVSEISQQTFADALSGHLDKAEF